MKIINIGILAHVDAGKTTLTESLLYASGAISEPGSVEKGTTRTDTMFLERQPQVPGSADLHPSGHSIRDPRLLSGLHSSGTPTDLPMAADNFGTEVTEPTIVAKGR